MQDTHWHMIEMIINVAVKNVYFILPEKAAEKLPRQPCIEALLSDSC